MKTKSSTKDVLLLKEEIKSFSGINLDPLMKYIVNLIECSNLEHGPEVLFLFIQDIVISYLLLFLKDAKNSGENPDMEEWFDFFSEKCKKSYYS